MSLNSRKELLESIRKEYRKASKPRKSQLLDSLCLSCNYNRKYAIRILQKQRHSKARRYKNKVGRPPEYNNPLITEFILSLRVKTNLMCSKRLKEAAPNWMDHYKTITGKILDSDVKDKLLRISSATIDRIIKKSNLCFEKIGFSTTKPGSIIKSQIRINTNQWDETHPGYLEADTVAHCGGSLSGNFIYSLNTVDIKTAWIESRALWNKGQHETVNALSDIENSLPFRLKGLDTDNGSEFINWHMINYLRNRTKKKRVLFTRSRPYHKNDNAHIEGKNWTHTRQYLGYSRFDTTELLKVMNDLYKNEWSKFFNFFIPSQKCISKVRDKSKMIKKFDKAKTPYERVLESEYIDDKIKRKLTREFKKLNPYELQKTLFDKIKTIKNMAIVDYVKIVQ